MTPQGEAEASAIDAARAARRNAYAPYSKFPVGAAVVTGDGSVFAGCNVENASFGLTICAERVAVFLAVASGRSDIRLVVVETPTAEPTAPCGACRQVINEFAPGARILCVCDTVARFDEPLSNLLPLAFGPGNLP